MMPLAVPHSRGGEPGDVQTRENLGSLSKPLVDAKEVTENVSSSRANV